MPSHDSREFCQSTSCPTCNGVAVVKHGTTSDGKQRFRCQNLQCASVTFIRSYTYQGLLPEVKRQVIDMSLNGRGSRAIARVLHISPSTVIQALKKRDGTATCE
jgi:transposase-like protein